MRLNSKKKANLPTSAPVLTDESQLALGVCLAVGQITPKALITGVLKAAYISPDALKTLVDLKPPALIEIGADYHLGNPKDIAAAMKGVPFRFGSFYALSAWLIGYSDHCLNFEPPSVLVAFLEHLSGAYDLGRKLEKLREGGLTSAFIANSLNLTVVMGRVHAKLANFSEALDKFQQACRLSRAVYKVNAPEMATLYADTSTVAQILGDWDCAIAHTELLIQVDVGRYGAGCCPVFAQHYLRLAHLSACKADFKAMEVYLVRVTAYHYATPRPAPAKNLLSTAVGVPEHVSENKKPSELGIVPSC